MKAVLIGDCSASEGQKVWQCWMCCWIWFSFVFLVTVGQLVAVGRVWCDTAGADVPRARGRQPVQLCQLEQMGRRGSGAAPPAQGTSHQRGDALELDTGSGLPPLPAASSNVMLLWLSSVWLEVCAVLLRRSAVPDLASLSGKGINTEKRLERPLEWEPSRQLLQKIAWEVLSGLISLFTCVFF